MNTNNPETVDNSYYVELLNSLKKLEKNDDFKKVILNGYLKEKVLDSVSLLANHEIKKQGYRGDVIEDLVAASNLKEYFRIIYNLGSTNDDIEDALKEEEDK